MPTALDREIRWFRNEIALCEQAIRELEASGAGAAGDKSLASLRDCLASHRQTLADLEATLTKPPVHLGLTV